MASIKRPPTSTPRHAAKVLACASFVTALAVVAIFVSFVPHKSTLVRKDQIWHGGHPSEDRSGSCWCGGDRYCMCGPSLAVDIVVHSKRESTLQDPDDIGYDVYVVRRSDTNQLATIGGFVNVGETTEAAVIRELEEETGIVVSEDQGLRLIGVYSDPRRDNRRSIASVAYGVEVNRDEMVTKDGSGLPRAGDDAKEVVSIKLRDVGLVDRDDFYADHLTILNDFKAQIMPDEPVQRSGELFADIGRITCTSEPIE